MPSASPHLDTLYFVFYGIVITAISIFGIFANLLSIVVFSRQSMRCSNSTILLALSVWDVVLLVTYLFSYGFPSLVGNYSDINSRFASNFTPYIYLYGTRALRKAGHTGSVYSTLLVTLERYLAVCHPFFSRYWCTRGKAVVASITIGAFSIFFNLPRWFDMTVNEIYDVNINGTEDVRYEFYNNLQSNVFYMKYYRGWARSIVMYTTPFLVLPVLNYHIYNQVKRTNDSRQNMTWFQQTEISISKTLMAIVTMFLVSNIPYALFSVSRILGIIEIPPVLEISAHVLVAANSSFNFIIYYAMGTKFRGELIRMYFSMFNSPKYYTYRRGRFLVVAQLNSGQSTMCSRV